jgi:hypothetical protein
VRKIAEAVLVLALLLAIGQAKCSGVREGAIREQVKVLVAERATLKKSINLTKDSLLVKDKELSLLKSRLPRVVTRYHTLRDTLLLKDSTASIPIAEVLPVLRAADSVIAVQAQIIEAHERKDVLQEAVISKQDSAIQSLNRQISLTARQNKPPFLSRLADTGKKAVVGYVVFRGVEAALTR